MPSLQTGRQAGNASLGVVQLGWLGETIGYNLRVAHDASFQAFSGQAGDIGLVPGRYALLQLIADNPGISQTALSHAVGRDKSTLTPLLADLERRGMVIRTPDPADKRGRKLTLAEAGVATLAVLADCARRHEDRLNAILGSGRKQFLEMLHLLIEDLGRDAGRELSIADEG